MKLWQEIWSTTTGEFADLSAVQATQWLIRLLIAAMLGALIGWQRASVGKAAGVRTHMLVAIGCASLIAVTQLSGFNEDAVSRVLQGLITGIGFLGAGCIVKSKEEGQVQGLTTAAGIWLTACIGVASGLGRELSATILAAVGWVTLALLFEPDDHHHV